MPPASPSLRRRAAIATALTLAGVVGYFLAVLYLPWLPGVRNHAVPNLVLAGAGAVLALAAARRGGLGVRVVAAANVVLAAAFVWMLFGMSAVSPGAGPALGTPAPAVALADEQGRPVRLADFRGSPLLLVFYRGHW